jgi:purine-binding chemotaxis protein CheW
MTLKSFATFMLNDQLFGINILLIREINKQLDITPVPQAPSAIRGLVNLRGQIVTILDLKSRLSLGACALDQDCHNIILSTDVELNVHHRNEEEDSDEFFAIPDKVGLLVDGIGEVVTVEESEIDPPPANIGEVDGKFLLGVVKLEKRLMAILSTRQILEN